MLTAKRLRELYVYDPAAGVFLRRARPRQKVGQVAGCVSDTGYVLISADNRLYKAHRLAWLYMTGDWPEADVDHINGNRADNCWGNLRAATRSQNLHNTGPRKTNKSGIKGVSFDKSKGLWRAQIRNGVANKFIGRYPTKEGAAAAYEVVAKRLFGEFARAA